MTETVQGHERWPLSPGIIEVNTIPWLASLGVASLADVPDDQWDRFASPGIDAAWLMGAWERSDAGRTIALGDQAVVEECRRALPGMSEADFLGSAYCIRSYTPDARIGGHEGLVAAREALAARGLRLVLDYVPNHVAIDHPWPAERPDLLVQGTPSDLERDPGSFHAIADRVFACGRDPNFPAWRDTLQVNVFAPGARTAAAADLEDIAALCDGVRCDMAMLLLSPVFERTWGERAGPRPAGEFWSDVIGAVRALHPGFVFIAEAYWGTEARLIELGFDFCYDKTLYDRLRASGAGAVREHLGAVSDYQRRLVRFIENHDEQRAIEAFGAQRSRAAAVAALTLPGARLLHDGQAAGFRTRLPVFLGRRPPETEDGEMAAFYDSLARAIDHPALGLGQWQLLETRGWPDNRTNENLLAWAWERGEERLLIVVNYSGAPAQGRVAFPWPGTSTAERQLRDYLSGETYWRATAELLEQGLYVDLGPWQSHVLDATPASG